MTFNEFLEYMTENLEGYATFYKKAFAYHSSKNKRRKREWNEAKINRTVNEMWKKSMQPLYDKLKAANGKNSKSTWIEYIEKYEILESINEGMSELEFE